MKVGGIRMLAIINKAKRLNASFDKLSTQRQFEFIVKYVDKNVIMQELIWYYDEQFGCPYETDILIRKSNANRIKLEEAQI